MINQNVGHMPVPQLPGHLPDIGPQTHKDGHLSTPASCQREKIALLRKALMHICTPHARTHAHTHASPSLHTCPHLLQQSVFRHLSPSPNPEHPTPPQSHTRSHTHTHYFFLFFLRKIGFDTSCKLPPPSEAVCMKFQILFSGKIRKKGQRSTPLIHLVDVVLPFQFSKKDKCPGWGRGKSSYTNKPCFKQNLN